jgi:hypothetical protein
MASRRDVVVVAFDDDIAPAREGETHEKVLASSSRAARARDGAEGAAASRALSELVGFVLASRSIARAFAPRDASDEDALEFSVARTRGARVASVRARGTNSYACARVDEGAAPRWSTSDGELRAMLARVVEAYEEGVRTNGAAADDRIARREAWTRAAAADEDEGATSRGLDKYAVFYGRERARNEGGLELTTAAPAGARTEMDPRTASTLALLRRDVERASDGDAIEHAYVKPGHEAWVCVSATADERRYVAIEDTSDTLLRCARRVKTFAQKSFPDASGAFDVIEDS